MQQTVLVTGVYLIPVLVIEQRCNILEGFWSSSASNTFAIIYARGDAEGRIVGGNLCDALAGRNLTHVDGPNWSNCRWNFCQGNFPQIVLQTREVLPWYAQLSLVILIHIYNVVQYTSLSKI